MHFEGELKLTGVGSEIILPTSALVLYSLPSSLTCEGAGWAVEAARRVKPGIFCLFHFLFSVMVSDLRC